MQVGSEFLHLCQEQVNLLTDGFGASLAIVALVERPIRDVNTREVTFLPVITYPDAFTSVDPQTLKLWLLDIWLAEMHQGSTVPYEEPVTTEQAGEQQTENHDLSLLNDMEPRSPKTKGLGEHETVISSSGGSLSPRVPLVVPNQNQIVMPLIYQELMVGILVTTRVDRGWNQLERYDIERVGHTLAAACVLEQRSQWLEQRLHQQATAYARINEHQQDVLDDVLHQFRNPLTALRTFGKLLIKRLQPSDRNHTVAESIVRESDRLQDLLTQLSAAAEIPSMVLSSTQDPSPNTSLPTTALMPSISESQTSSSDLSTPASNVERPKELRAEEAYDAIASKQNSELMDITGVAKPSSSDTVKALTGHSLQLQVCDPMDVLDPLFLSAQAIAQDRSLSLCVTCSEYRGSIWADAQALREVYNNLIDNALKYTPPHGRVDIIVGIEPDQIAFDHEDDPSVLGDHPMQGVAIADTGPGIPIADQAHLFERHFRGIQSQGDIPGTGLGLAIAQLLTQQMGGIIQVFSPIETCPLNPLKQILEQARQPTDMPDALATKNIQSLAPTYPQTSTSGFEGADILSSEPRNAHTTTPVVGGAGTLFIVWLPRDRPQK